MINVPMKPIPNAGVKKVASKLARINVLVLDSSPDVTALVESMLREFGFTRLYSANNGYNGVQILRKVRMNLIITDWELKISPVEESGSDLISHSDVIPLSGLDFVRRLRQSPASPNPYLPVIMLADISEKLQLMAARDAGVNEICTKPLNAEGLSDSIMAVIDKPRIFITAKTYKGPCRRIVRLRLPPGQPERRIRQVRIVRCNESVR